MCTQNDVQLYTLNIKRDITRLKLRTLWLAVLTLTQEV